MQLLCFKDGSSGRVAAQTTMLHQTM
uniref:Uncharacterized protein n=1 Tax=Arundo donax TaxID=35708 RepID=A0A0A8ZZA3_ARUDO